MPNSLFLKGFILGVKFTFWLYHSHHITTLNAVSCYIEPSHSSGFEILMFSDEVLIMLMLWCFFAAYKNNQLTK